MLKGLKDTVSHITHIPLPDLPVDIPLPLGLSTELVTEDGGLNVPIVGDPLSGVGALTGVLGMLSGLSLSGIVDFIKNLSWEYVLNLIQTVSVQLRGYIEDFAGKYLGPYKKFLEENKVMLIYGAIAIGILLFPILLFILFVFIVIGLGFVLYLILIGLVIGAGFVVLAVVLVPLLILLLLIGLIVFCVVWIIKQFQKRDDTEGSSGEGGDSPTTRDSQGHDPSKEEKPKREKEL